MRFPLFLHLWDEMSTWGRPLPTRYAFHSLHVNRSANSFPAFRGKQECRSRQPISASLRYSPPQIECNPLTAPFLFVIEKKRRSLDNQVSTEKTDNRSLHVKDDTAGGRGVSASLFFIIPSPCMVVFFNVSVTVRSWNFPAMPFPRKPNLFYFCGKQSVT